MSNRIREVRRAKDITQTELANKVGVTQTYIVDLEKGRRGAKSETKARIAEALGVTVQDLWGGEAVEPADNPSSG